MRLGSSRGAARDGARRLSCWSRTTIATTTAATAVLLFRARLARREPKRFSATHPLRSHPRNYQPPAFYPAPGRA